ncbi:MAG TPA: efflux RND transporter periplasmic adaptor subunit [Saprospiraceae bacterium]|nr:efflux RND transporter periplasmic adaptor subunit [Saprospiraceae bacterium]
MNHSILLFSILASILLFSSCGNSSEKPVQHIQEEKTDLLLDKKEANEKKIQLTKKQVEAMNISFGDFSQIKISKFVSATGTLGLPPNAYSSVSAKTKGFIKESKKYVEGSYIKKGEIMAYLENPDLILDQQTYLEVAAELRFLKQELSRQKELLDANAGVLKNVQKLSAQVDMKTATLKGIAQRLAYLGISVNNLTTNNIVHRITILAPMSGYVTSINMHNGMHVTPEQELMVIVSENHLHLELDVFEKDIALIKADQKISYTVPALGSEVYEGEVHVIGKEFNVENKTIRIHGHLEKKRPKFIKDLFIEAKIWLNDRTVQALPEESIIKDGAFSCIYVAKEKQDGAEIEFEQIKVIAGATDKGFTSVKLIDPISDDKKIVTNGAYYVYAQSKLGEGGEHEH